VEGIELKTFCSSTALLVSLFCGITCIFSSSISGQDLPTLVQTAHFSAAQKPKSTVSLAQSELSLNAFLFFDRGLKLLSTYKEPQLIRGAKGVSIFRDVSPAVTLVVTGDDKNLDGLGTGVIVDAERLNDVSGRLSL
jgi:hypothetical protein